MIVSHHHNIMITGETLAVIREKIVAAAGSEPAAMHVDHDWALVGPTDLRRPKIQAQAVFAGHCRSRATVQHELIFVGVRQIFPVSIKVGRVLIRANAAILQRVANSSPRFRFNWWHEASLASCGSAIGKTFEGVDAIAPEAPDLSSGRFCNGRGIGGGNCAACATARC